MSFIIQGDFDNVPTAEKLIPTGIYTLRVEAAQIKPKKDNKPGTNLALDLKVDEEGEFKDRQLSLYVPTDNLIRIKQVFVACGIPLGKEGADITRLIGAKFKASVVLGTYVDAAGVSKDTSNIKEVLQSDGSSFKA